MAKVKDILEYLEAFAPIGMKMDFDNVGLLVGRADADVSRILVSLDITSGVVGEALDTGAELVVSHHPLFFSLKSVTDADITGRKIIGLLSGGVSAICMHTNLDAAHGGVNDALASAAGLVNPTELLSEEGRLASGEAFSYGRVGYLAKPQSLSEYLKTLKASLGADGLRYHDTGREVYKVAVAGGSGGSDMHHAVRHGCDTFLTADIKYDIFLEAKELGLNLIDGGHFCTENVVTGVLAENLRQSFTGISVTVSQTHGSVPRFYTD